MRFLNMSAVFLQQGKDKQKYWSGNNYCQKYYRRPTIFNILS